MPPKPVNARDVELLRALAGYREARGQMPSHAELAKLMGFRHPYDATRFVARLEQLGLIAPRVARARRTAVITPAGRRLLRSDG